MAAFLVACRQRTLGEFLVEEELVRSLNAVSNLWIHDIDEPESSISICS